MSQMALMKEIGEKNYRLRHSAAHLLAQAVLELYPEAKMTIGPVTETGFFYDFYLPGGKSFREEDLPKIEERMREISERSLEIVGREISKEEAKKLFANNKFKLELINSIPEDEPISIYCQGEFCDLCRGYHVANTAEIKFFKLTSVAGAYWRADKNNEKLQRIYGVAFWTEKELEDYLRRVEEAKLRDHRKIGKEQKLFFFKPIAPGIPFLQDKGTKIFNVLLEYMRRLQEREGYWEVRTPLIMNKSLWVQSGHYDNYKSNMFFTEAEGEEFAVRPMNCPGSMMIYKSDLRSYRDLPLRIAEFGIDHRLELSGVLHGLFRVRGFTMDDAHIFCTEDQIKDEVVGVLKLAREVYSKFGFGEVRYTVATRPEKFIGEVELWDKATEALKDALREIGVEFEVEEGEGAFYGPKIELRIRDAVGREWQCGTVQIDFFMPKNFGLEYVASDQSRRTPVVVHRAIYGSLERFMGILIEHYAGKLPYWIAPEQIRILTVNDEVLPFAENLFEQLHSRGIRVTIDKSGDKLPAKIRRAQVERASWMLIVGKREAENGTVSIRYLDGRQENGVPVSTLIERAVEEARF